MNVPLILFSGLIGVFVLTLINPFYAVTVFIFGHFVEPVQFFPYLREFDPSLLVGYVVLGAWILHVVFTGNFIPAKNKLVAIVLIFIVWTFLCTGMGTYETWHNQNMLIKNLIPFFIFVYMVQSRKQVIFTVWLLLIMGAIAAVYGMYCLKANIGVSDHGIVRITSFMANPNAFGKTMAMLIPIAICLMLSSYNKKVKLCLAFIVLLLITGVVMSYSRTSMIAMLFVLIFTPLMYYRGSKKIAALMITLMILPGLYFFFPLDNVKWRAHNRLVTAFEAESMEEVDKGRVETAKAGWMMMLNNPLFGVGIGGFGHEYKQLAQTSAELELVESRYGDRGLSAHNLYVQVGGQLGLAGLILYLYLLIYAYYILKRSEEIFHSTGDERLYTITRSYKIFILAFMIIGITSSGLGNKLFWIVIGFGIALHRLALEHHNKDNTENLSAGKEI
ncbi:MAG: O-antigen ligase family protein [bacterium]